MFKNIRYLYLLNKYIKCNFGGQRYGTSTIDDIRGLKVNSTEKGGPGRTTVVDFRKLNEKTIGDAHPLPDITEILDQLGQSKYFTCLDMVMVYHQIELEPGEGSKTD